MSEKLVSMKLTEADRKKRQEAYVPEIPKEQYPYGLNICLEDAALKKLGIDKLPSVGEKITLVAKVEVTGANLDKRKDGDRMRMNLQITDLALGDKKDLDGAEKKLYGEAE